MESLPRVIPVPSFSRFRLPTLPAVVVCSHNMAAFRPPSTSAAKFPSTRFPFLPFFTNHTALFPINPLRPFPLSLPTSTSRHRGFRIHAATPGPREPRNPSEEGRLRGIVTSLSTVQDRVQIFFAVLFWMSLFFWASAWDGRNRPDKGSRFRR